MASTGGPPIFFPTAKAGASKPMNNSTTSLSLSGPSSPSSPNSSPLVKSSNVCASLYAPLILEEETELFDQDPTLGRSGQRDFSAGGEEYSDDREAAEQPPQQRLLKGITPVHVDWPSLTPVEPSSALVAAVKKAMSEAPKLE